MGSLLIIHLVLLLLCAGKASLFTMLTEGEIFIMNEGEEVSLSCNFFLHNFSKFHNPVIWHKHQRGEVTRVNMGGNVLSPFRTTKRLHLAFRESPPRYSLQLSLSDISLEDSGNYSCVIRGPGNNVIGQVTHYIFVRAAVEKIFFMDYRDPDGRVLPPGGTLTMVEGKPFQFACVSIGGYPPPDITVYADKRNITGLFVFERLTQLAGVQAMKLIVSEIVASNEIYTPSRADDGVHLRCQAVVVGISPSDVTAVLDIHHAPIITCRITEAVLGQRNAYLKCSVEANPSLNTVFWNLDDKGTSLIPGNIVNDMWTITIDQDPTHVDVHLYMRIVTEESFRDYVICAENAVDATTQKISLVQKPEVKQKNKKPIERFIDSNINDDSLDTQPLVEETKPEGTSSQSSTIVTSSSFVLCAISLFLARTLVA